MSVFTTRPIPFRPELVARIRSGHKTETRRLSGVEALTLRTRSEVRENGRSVRFADDGETFPEGSEPLREWTMWDVRLRTPRRGLVTSYSGAPVDVAAARQVIASQFCPLGTAGDGLWVKEPVADRHGPRWRPPGSHPLQGRRAPVGPDAGGQADGAAAHVRPLAISALHAPLGFAHRPGCRVVEPG